MGNIDLKVGEWREKYGKKRAAKKRLLSKKRIVG